MRSVSLVVALVVAIVLAAIASPSPEVTYRIDHVTDGDTVVLRNGQTIGAGAPWFYEGRRGRYAARLEALAKGAKANELGLWGACARRRCTTRTTALRRDVKPPASQDRHFSEVPEPGWTSQIG